MCLQKCHTDDDDDDDVTHMRGFSVTYDFNYDGNRHIREEHIKKGFSFCEMEMYVYGDDKNRGEQILFYFRK